MKKDLHPEWYPEAKVICDGEVVMIVGSTKPEIRVDIWSGNHPFYTGQQRLVDTEGQVERFMRRLKRREDLRTSVEDEQEAYQPEALTIDAMSVGTRAEKALLAADLTTVGDVLALWQEQGDDGLLALSGVGQKALIDVKRHLRAEGLIE